MPIHIKTGAEIALMREAGRIVAGALEKMVAAARPGVSLIELDALAADCIREAGATSSFLGYNGYPRVLCTSPNDMVVHGIPDERRLVEGDIVGIDFGVSWKGFHADAARTVAVGAVRAEHARLIQVTRDSLDRGIAAARVGGRVGDIGHAVQSYVEAAGYSIVRDFVGHGIGRRMHEEPQIPNYGQPGRGERLRAGMVIAVEPMVNLGRPDVRILPDRWSVVTVDGSWSAHFEDTVLLTEAGPQVLTRDVR